MNEVIVFFNDFTSEDKTYSWVANTKYGLSHEDSNFYYIKRVKNINGRYVEIKPYPISRSLKGIAYSIETLGQDNKN